MSMNTLKNINLDECNVKSDEMDEFSENNSLFCNNHMDEELSQQSVILNELDKAVNYSAENYNNSDLKSMKDKYSDDSVNKHL